jgi:hypothetical protein
MRPYGIELNGINVSATLHLSRTGSLEELVHARPLFGSFSIILLNPTDDRDLISRFAVNQSIPP